MGKLSNIKAVLSDTRSRTILLITLAIIFIGIGFGYWGLTSGTTATTGQARITGAAPRIKSVPGVGTPSREYIKTQQEENIRRAREAARTGGTAIPVITRAGLVGTGDFFAGTGGVDAGDCSPQALQKARAAGVSAAELRCKGCNAEQMRAAGFTAGELLEAGFSAKDLMTAGFTVAQLRDAGFTAEELLRGGASVADLLAAGFSPARLAEAGVSAEDLVAAGVLADALKAAGIVSTQQTLPKDCNVDELKKARDRGVSAGELKKMGCSAAAMRAAGYTAKELKDAGFTAKELHDAGFSAAELKAVGFTAGELKAAGFSADELKAAGFSAKELRDAGFSAEDLLTAGFSAGELKAAGFSDGDLVRAGLSPEQVYGIRAAAAAAVTAGCSVAELRQARAQGVSASVLKARGCPVEALLAAGFTAKELKDAGVSAAQLLAAGVSPAQLLAAGFSPAELVAAGVSQAQLARAAELAAGITAAGAAAAIPSLTTQDQADLSALEQLQQRQRQQLSQQQREELLSQLQSAMASQAGELISSWSPPPTQQFVEGTDTQTEAAAQKAAAEAAANATSTQAQKPVVKAGTVMYAVLDTAINSDEPSPIMATIVDGKYKGAKLIGSFTRENKKVVLKFNVMSLENYPNSISINAVAIDPSTARTALATDVNNHYLLRYGTLFASSFLEGLGDAITDSGTTTIFGVVPVTTNKELSNTETVLAALGDVGKRSGREFRKTFSKPPTVKVRAGMGIGILFMADVTLGEPGPTAAELNTQQAKEQQQKQEAQAQAQANEATVLAAQAAQNNVVQVVSTPYSAYSRLIER